MTKQLSDSLLAACKAAGIETPKYIAQDENGTVWHYDGKPDTTFTLDVGIFSFYPNFGERTINLDHLPYADDWKESLLEWVDHVADTSKMTDEQINIAIAEACGWHCNQFGLWGIDFVDGVSGSPPDCCNDFNAMHEAMLLHPRKELLRDFLYLEVLEDPTNTTNEPAWATAKQWATAYLRSIGKWIE